MLAPSPVLSQQYSSCLNQYATISDSENNFFQFETVVRNRINTGGVYRTHRQADFNQYPSENFDHFCVRMQALFSPDATGEYSFYLNGDDFGMLFIGDDETSTSRKKVAQMSRGTTDLS